MGTSIWPNDIYNTPTPTLDKKSLGSVRCFLACPFEPRDRWDDLLSLVTDVCNLVGQSIGINLECFRADSIISSGVIHPEIWEALRSSDLIIFDVSGQNGNVLLELGVASAWRKKEHVIILRDKNDDKPRLFDINPARHIEYEISYSGLKKLSEDLHKVMADVLASVPFEIRIPSTISLPFKADLTDGKDAPELYTEDFTHRSLKDGFLEFGAPYIYRYSWMSLGDLRIPNVHVKADLKLTMNHPHLQPFMGIMLRGQNYFANYGHLVFVHSDGEVYLTVREDDTGKYHDELVGEISNFDINQFTPFDLRIDTMELKASVGKFSFQRSLNQLPYVFTTGRIIFIAGYCRIGIRNVEIEIIQPLNG